MPALTIYVRPINSVFQTDTGTSLKTASPAVLAEKAAKTLLDLLLVVMSVFVQMVAIRKIVNSRDHAMALCV
jgi:hypothetical protein